VVTATSTSSSLDSGFLRAISGRVNNTELLLHFSAFSTVLLTINSHGDLAHDLLIRTSVVLNHVIASGKTLDHAFKVSIAVTLLSGGLTCCALTSFSTGGIICGSVLLSG